MKLTEVNINTVRKDTYGGKLLDTIEEFIKMDVECVEVDTTGYANPASCASALIGSCKRANRGVMACLRNGKVYLYKKSAWGE